MSQFWAGGEVERQPSSESIRGALRTLPWGWWVSAQPMAVPMAPIPPPPACWGSGCGTVATKQLPQGSIELRHSLPVPKRTLGVCDLLPKCPHGCPQLSCSLTACSRGSPGQGRAGGCWWPL